MIVCREQGPQNAVVISNMNDTVICLCDCVLPVSQLLAIDYEKLTEALISSVSAVGSE